MSLAKVVGGKKHKRDFSWKHQSIYFIPSCWFPRYIKFEWRLITIDDNTICAYQSDSEQLWSFFETWSKCVIMINILSYLIMAAMHVIHDPVQCRTRHFITCHAIPYAMPGHAYMYVCVCPYISVCVCVCEWELVLIWIKIKGRETDVRRRQTSSFSNNGVRSALIGSRILMQLKIYINVKKKGQKHCWPLTSIIG